VFELRAESAASNPFYDQTVRMLRARNKDGDQCSRCELPDGTTASIPPWMTAAETCAQMSAGEPSIGLATLASRARHRASVRIRNHRLSQSLVGRLPNESENEDLLSSSANIAPVSIRALAVMAPSQTLTHTLAYILRAMRIAARESPKALRCGLLKTRLLLIALYFCAALV
jgi:hypothetical protein